mmetsp:Transcript_863/g.3596  ORF Transcript_863/g.3596 Transcript_863/m.3596 type:complete len:225 (+) Transcript_863:135-809(+)
MSTTPLGIPSLSTMNPSSPTGASKMALVSGAPGYTGGAENRSTPGAAVAREEEVSAPLSMNVTSSPLISSTSFSSSTTLGLNLLSQDQSHEPKTCDTNAPSATSSSESCRVKTPGSDSETHRAFRGSAKDEPVAFPDSENNTAGVSGAWVGATAKANSLLGIHVLTTQTFGRSSPAGAIFTGDPPCGTTYTECTGPSKPACCSLAVVAGCMHPVYTSKVVRRYS